MKSQRWAASALVACLLVGWGSGCSSGKRMGGVRDKPSFLSVMQASGGTLVSTGDEDKLTLTLDGVAPQTVAFSDRPQRIAAAVGTRKLLDLWTTEFRGDPPNAALVLLNGKEDADTIVLALRSP